MPATLPRPISAAALALLVACATPGGPGVPVAIDPGVDFNAYRTFDFVPIPASVTSAMSPSLGYFGVDRVLATDLATVGLSRSLGGQPDVLVAYFAGGTVVNTDAWGYASGSAAGISVLDVPASSLVVDVVDARMRKLVWRGVAEGALLGPQNVDPAVRQMLRSYWPARQRY